MRILGISTIGRGSAVALLEEKSILFAIEEEKLNRLQDALEIPRLALERCLHENQLKLADSRGKRATRSAFEDLLQPLLRGGPRLSRFDHHLCHAASAYYTSGFDRALILTLDQGANSQAGLVALGDGDEIEPLHSLKFPDSIGWFYSRVT